MTEAMITALIRAQELMQSVFTLTEAADVAIMENDLDEFQAEDLIIRLRNKQARQAK
jgi:hypothetical protein